MGGFAFRLEYEEGRRPSHERSRPPYRTGGPATRFIWAGKGRCAWLPFGTATRINLRRWWFKTRVKREKGTCGAAGRVERNQSADLLSDHQAGSVHRGRGPGGRFAGGGASRALVLERA